MIFKGKQQGKEDAGIAVLVMAACMARGKFCAPMDRFVRFINSWARVIILIKSRLFLAREIHGAKPACARNAPLTLRAGNHFNILKSFKILILVLQVILRFLLLGGFKAFCFRKVIFQGLLHLFRFIRCGPPSFFQAKPTGQAVQTLGLF